MNDSDEAIKEAFEVFDKDNDGVILGSEVPTVVRSLGKVPTAEEAAKIIEEVGGENAKVNLSKCSTQCKKKFKKPNDLEREMRSAFNALDRDGNGCIRDAELRQVLGS